LVFGVIGAHYITYQCNELCAMQPTNRVLYKQPIRSHTGTRGLIQAVELVLYRHTGIQAYRHTGGPQTAYIQHLDVVADFGVPRDPIDPPIELSIA
jgi:hypothetical protein